LEENKESIDDLCLYFNISRLQRNTELSNGVGLKGTEGYQIRGCYDCNGYNQQCNVYINSAAVYGVKDQKKDTLKN